MPAVAQVFESGALIFRGYTPEEGQPYAVVAGNNLDERTEVEIPSEVTYNDVTYTVTAIGDEAFKNNAYVTGVDIPETVTSIGKQAFFYNNNLSRLDIPGSVKVVGESAFHGCKNLMFVTIANGVEEIGTKAFCFAALRNVTIPVSVKKLGSYVFYYSQETIEDFTIEDSTEPLYLVADKEDHNYMLAEAEVENLYIGRNLMPAPDADGKIDETLPMYLASVGVQSGSTIRNLTLGKNVTDIWPGLFRDFKDIKTLLIPSTVKTIGAEAFSMCSALEKVNFESGVQSIGENAFSACRQITNLTLPGGLKTIGRAAFAYCSGVGVLRIPGSIAEFGDYAFYNCTGLMDIYYATSEPVAATAELFVPDIYAEATLYVAPDGAANAHQTEPWSYFMAIEELAELSVEKIETAFDLNAPFEVYDLNGVLVGASLTNLPKGVYVVRQGEVSRKVAL